MWLNHDGSTTSPPGYVMNGHPVPHQHGHMDLGMLLGRLLERSEHTGEQLDRIEIRLANGAEVMRSQERRLDALETRGGEQTPPAWEGVVKDILRWAVPAGAAWATGHLDLALRLLEQAASK